MQRICRESEASLDYYSLFKSIMKRVPVPMSPLESLASSAVRTAHKVCGVPSPSPRPLPGLLPLLHRASHMQQEPAPCEPYNAVDKNGMPTHAKGMRLPVGTCTACSRSYRIMTPVFNKQVVGTVAS